MATLKKYNLAGKEVGTVDVDDAIAQAEANSQMIKEYIVALRANARQWSACTKGRSEIAHSTKKPHPQKGTGRARQGSLSSPQFRGGGVVFGPKPKFDQHVRINRKERIACMRGILAEKIQSGNVHVLETMVLDAPKTKTVTEFLKVRNIDRRVLFCDETTFSDVEGTEEKVAIHTEKNDNFVKSINNIPKVNFTQATNINGYDLLVATDIVMTEEALCQVAQWLK